MRAATHLGGEELGGGIRVCVVRRDVDVPVNIVLGDRLHDPLGALDVDVREGEVPGSVSPSPQPNSPRASTHLVG